MLALARLSNKTQKLIQKTFQGHYSVIFLPASCWKHVLLLLLVIHEKIIKLLGCRSETCWKPVCHGFLWNQPLQDFLPPCQSRHHGAFVKSTRNRLRHWLATKTFIKKKYFHKQRYNKLCLFNPDKENHNHNFLGQNVLPWKTLYLLASTYLNLTRTLDWNLCNQIEGKIIK